MQEFLQSGVEVHSCPFVCADLELVDHTQEVFVLPRDVLQRFTDLGAATGLGNIQQENRLITE